MQLVHGLFELALHRQRQHVQRSGDAIEDRVLILRRRPTQHPRRDLITMARMANAYAQTMKLAVIQMRHDVAQSVLAAVAAIELHAYGTGGQIQIIVRDQALLWLDLVVAQRRNDSDATFIHEGGRLEQPHLLTTDPHPAGFAVQLAVETKAFTLPAGKTSGVVISHNLTEVEISCLPKHLPEFIELDLGELNPGDIVHLSELKLPENVEIVALHLGESHDTAVVTANTVQEEVDEAPAEGDAAAAAAPAAAAPAKKDDKK